MQGMGWRHLDTLVQSRAFLYKTQQLQRETMKHESKLATHLEMCFRAAQEKKRNTYNGSLQGPLFLSRVQRRSRWSGVGRWSRLKLKVLSCQMSTQDQHVQRFQFIDTIHYKLGFSACSISDSTESILNICPGVLMGHCESRYRPRSVRMWW